MSGHEHEGFGAGYWEDRYRNGGGASRREPSPSLLAEAADLRPGTALDAGCGGGSDALWLAARGWQVTAVDVSPAALAQAREAADAVDAGAAGRITWLAADLTTWEPAERFDLVTSHYVHVPGPPEALFARLASWVAPGGTLLVVGHGHPSGGADGHAAPETAQVGLPQITDSLHPGDWRVVVAEPRTHAVARAPGSSPTVLHDVVVRAERSRSENGG